MPDRPYYVRTWSSIAGFLKGAKWDEAVVPNRLAKRRLLTAADVRDRTIYGSLPVNSGLLAIGRMTQPQTFAIADEKPILPQFAGLGPPAAVKDLAPLPKASPCSAPSAR